MNTSSPDLHKAQEVDHKSTQNAPSVQDFLQNNPQKRTKCLVYTRVMGYHRPVESFNSGKQGEHKERRFFEHL